MKRNSPRKILSVENIVVIVMSLITLALLIAAVITHCKILLLSFGVSLLIYFGYTLVKYVWVYRKKKKQG